MTAGQSAVDWQFPMPAYLAAESQCSFESVVKVLLAVPSASPGCAS